MGRLPQNLRYQKEADRYLNTLPQREKKRIRRIKRIKSINDIRQRH